MVESERSRKRAFRGRGRGVRTAVVLAHTKTSINSVDQPYINVYSIHMKPVQIMLGEALLEALDATSEVSREGRSAVVRRAVAEYLARRRDEETRERYRQAYAGEGGLGSEFAGWEEQGTWPEE